MCLFVRMCVPLNLIGFSFFILVRHSKDFADGLCEGCKAVSDIFKFLAYYIFLGTKISLMWAHAPLLFSLVPNQPCAANSFNIDRSGTFCNLSNVSLSSLF